MALDTAQKRRSMMSMGRVTYAERVPSATNYDSAQDRLQMMWMYGGIGGVLPPYDFGDTPINPLVSFTRLRPSVTFLPRGV